MYTRSQLENLANNHKYASLGTQKYLTEAILDVQLSSNSPVAKVFCSHSSIDKQLVYGFKVELSKLGIELYLDWLDPDLPRTTSGDTAKLLRERIEHCDKFIVVVTENSKNSYWVSWELGIADQAKKLSDVALLPVKEDAKEFDQREYMRLYQTIEPGNKTGENYVFPAGGSQSNTTLVSWLKS